MGGIFFVLPYSVPLPGILFLVDAREVLRRDRPKLPGMKRARKDSHRIPGAGLHAVLQQVGEYGLNMALAQANYG